MYDTKNRKGMTAWSHMILFKSFRSITLQNLQKLNQPALYIFVHKALGHYTWYCEHDKHPLEGLSIFIRFHQSSNHRQFSCFKRSNSLHTPDCFCLFAATSKSWSPGVMEYFTGCKQSMGQSQRGLLVQEVVSQVDTPQISIVKRVTGKDDWCKKPK